MSDILSPSSSLHHTDPTTTKLDAFNQAFDPAAHFETVPELAARAFNRPRRETLEVRMDTNRVV